MTAGGLDLAEALRPRLWREVGEPGDLRARVGFERLGEQRMNALDAALRDLKHGLDHGMIGRRSVRDAPMQLDLLGARERHLHAAVEPIDAGIIEHDGGAFRHGRQADHAAAALAPVHHEGVLRDAVGERRRRGEFGDDALGIVDLGENQNVVELRRERRLAAFCDTSATLAPEHWTSKRNGKPAIERLAQS